MQAPGPGPAVGHFRVNFYPVPKSLEVHTSVTTPDSRPFQVSRTGHPGGTELVEFLTSPKGGMTTPGSHVSNLWENQHLSFGVQEQPTGAAKNNPC